MSGTGSLFGLDAGPVEGAQTAFWWAAYDHGVLLTPDGQGSLSTPMTEAVIDDMAARLSHALRTVVPA